MIPVEEALANKFLPKLLELQSISGRLRKLLALGDKRSGLGIPDPMEGAEKSTRRRRRTTNSWWSPSSRERPYQQSKIGPVSGEAEVTGGG